MGVNNEVNLKQMTRIADEIAEEAKQMEDRIEDLFEQTKRLQEAWRGETYKDFATIVNTLTDDFTRITKYFRVTLVKGIYGRRNDYAKASGKPNQAVPAVTAKTFQKLKIADQGDEIKFNEDRVNNFEDLLEKKFNKIEKFLENIEAKFSKIKWEGETGTSLKRELKLRVTETKSAIKEIKSAWKDNIRAARAAMKKAEDAGAKTSKKLDMSGLSTQARKASQNASALDKKSFGWDQNT